MQNVPKINEKQNLVSVSWWVYQVCGSDKTGFRNNEVKNIVFSYYMTIFKQLEI